MRLDRHHRKNSADEAPERHVRSAECAVFGMMFTSGFSASRCPAKMLWTFIVSLLPTCTWHLFVYISSILLLSPWLAHGAAAGVVVEGKEDTRISTAVGIVADKEEIIGFSPIAGAITFFALGDFGGASGSLYSGASVFCSFIRRRAHKSCVIPVQDTSYFEVQDSSAVADRATDRQYNRVWSMKPTTDRRACVR